MRLKNAKGQIAIFVVLVFQALFILFAMTINVALVVHDKINFQNSLDLAAYYGAKQQAEALNAMAHINYQMRQNWKLLAWRYRILGTLTQSHGRYTQGSTCNVASPIPPSQEYWCPQDKNCNVTCALPPPSSEVYQACQQFIRFFHGRFGVYSPDYCDKDYFLSVSYDVWKRGMDRDEINRSITANINIPPIPLMPSDLSGLIGGASLLANIARKATMDLRQAMTESCPAEGRINWLVAQMFLTHFRLDQKDRRIMLKQIYEKSLMRGLDLEGKSIQKTAEKVFLNNLSKANKENFTGNNGSIIEFNSFAGKPFQELFKPMKVFPVLNFLDVDDSTTNKDNCSARICPHNNLERHVNWLLADFRTHPLYNFLNQKKAGLHRLFQLNRELYQDHPLASLALGFYKAADRPLYYGLKAEMDYSPQNQIFSLSRGFKFKASALAKPFGGRFGPKPKQNDPLIPIIAEGAQNPMPLPVSPMILHPNYSRWPGDKWGLLDKSLHDNRSRFNFLNKIAGIYHNNLGYKRVYTIEAFLHQMPEDTSATHDPLARPPLGHGQGSLDTHPFSFMRLMELMAVYPDIYDLSHYSIAGNYMDTYFPKICRLLKGDLDANNTCNPKKANQIAFGAIPAFIRGDFGWPYSEEYRHKSGTAPEGTEVSIAPYFLKRSPRQINEGYIQPSFQDREGLDPKIIGRFFNTDSPRLALTQGNIFYSWLARDLPGDLLSSWVPPNHLLRYDDYMRADPPGRFLECKDKDDMPGQALLDKPVPSACAAGGRSGYSVKLISCAMAEEEGLKGDLPPGFCN